MEQQIIDTVRGILLQAAPGNVIERKMYGGLVYELPNTQPKRLFAGLFKRQGYVTLEFDKGAHMKDPQKVLEGTGKDRRHIKLMSIEEVETKNVKGYILQSLGQRASD